MIPRTLLRGLHSSSRGRWSSATASTSLHSTIGAMPTAAAAQSPSTVPSLATKAISKDAKEAIERAQSRHSFVSRFINVVMSTGHKRALVEEQVRQGLLLIHQRTHSNPVQLFERAIDTLKPAVECGRDTTSHVTVRVPMPVSEYRGTAYAFRWLKQELGKKRRPAVKFPVRFANEVIKILEGKSALLQKRSLFHRDAVMNRAFTNRRWTVGKQSGQQLKRSAAVSAVKPSSEDDQQQQRLVA